MDVLGRQGRHVLSPPDRIGDEPPVTGRWSGDPVVYDRWFDERWGRWAFAVEAQALLDAAPGLEGARALDAGCGTGRFATVLADAGATVVGIDPDAGMAGLAATRLPGRCGRGAIEQLPFPDGAFDVAVAVTVLEFVDDPAVAMAELARVTRDGGRILVGALNPHSPWGLANRRRLRSGIWRDARFLSRRQLLALGAPHGPATLHAALYAPRSGPGQTAVGPLLELIGRWAPAWGAFQVLAVTKPSERS